MADWKSSMRADPSEWLVYNAAAPTKLRLLTELHSLTTADPNILRLQQEVQKWAPAKAELKYQRVDGSFGGRISAGDPVKAERSTEKVLWYLCELTWGKEDSKEIRKAAKLLKSQLSHKREMPLHEFKAEVKQDPIREKFRVWYLRVLSLALLLRCGYHDDRKVLDGVADLLERAVAMVADPVSRHLVEHVGSGLPQVRREAMRDGYLFVPDMDMLRTFAHCPQLLDAAKAKIALKRIFDYVMSADYQELGPKLGAIRTMRGSIPREGGIILRPIEEYLEGGCIEELLVMLELFARLGLVNRYPQLMAYVEWLVAHQEKDGRWDLPVKYFGAKPLFTSWIRLEKDWKAPQRRIADVTFRIMLILKYQWERQAKMLDRGADMYGY